MGKFYAVKSGKNVGIYETWEECQEQVKGYPKAMFKGFRTKEEAQQYLSNGTSKKSDTLEDNSAVKVYYSLKKQDKHYLLIVEILTNFSNDTYISRLDMTYDIYYTRLYGVLATLELVMSLGYTNIKLYYDDMSVYNYITREWNPLKGKNKELTMDYYNIFIIITKSRCANIDFNAIDVGDEIPKKLKSLLKNGISDRIITLEDIQKNRVSKEDFNII